MAGGWEQATSALSCLEFLFDKELLFAAASIVVLEFRLSALEGRGTLRGFTCPLGVILTTRILAGTTNRHRPPTVCSNPNNTEDVP